LSVSHAVRQHDGQAPLKVLIVKLSSLGDVVHAMPAVMDIQVALPNAQIDWVVERGFAPLAARCAAVHRVIPCDIRRWRKSPFSAQTRAQWRAFRDDLHAQAYDVVIDLQGLTKSAWVSWLAKLSPNGKRYAMANQTDGSGYERPTRWVADVAITLPAHIHAMTRSRALCADIFEYTHSDSPHFGLGHSQPQQPPCVVLVHGTSRADKEWPADRWVALGQRLQQAGFDLALPHGNEAELAHSQWLAQQLPGAQVWPRLSLDELTQRMSICSGVVGVDSGLSHIAVALDLPHVQIYNFDTAWRTGPEGVAYQCSVVDMQVPSVDAVWQAWQQCWQMHGAQP
jgi:heptosyltransferase-1